MPRSRGSGGAVAERTDAARREGGGRRKMGLRQSRSWRGGEGRRVEVVWKKEGVVGVRKEYYGWAPFLHTPTRLPPATSHLPAAP